MIDISTMLMMSFFSSLTLDIKTYRQEETTFKSVSVEGMTFHWKFSKDFLNCRVMASTTGWVAIGFNTSDQLAGTNLIMGAVKNESVIIQDHFIIEPGKHLNILELGGSDSIVKKQGKESGGSTEISFSVPLSVNDKYHHNLTEGEVIYLLMAYSQEDDFAHHSIMRRTIKIEL